MIEGTPQSKQLSRYTRDVLSATTMWLCLGASAAPAATRPAAELPGDVQIEHEVSDRLLLDHGVEGNAIDVESTSGIVTLSGTTANLLAKQRAARIAATMRGVRSIINNIQVKPVMRLDRHIHADIRLALFENVRTEGFQVDMDVNDGVVTLTGTVDSFQERKLVERVASGVQGVSGVKNRIEVRIGDRIDMEIADDVRGALHWDRYIESAPITVSVEKGHVKLRGKVGSVAERKRAIADAWVIGAKGVDASALVVDPAYAHSSQREPGKPRLSDDAIAEAIEDAFLLDPRVMSGHVFIEVDDGVVTLRGSADVLIGKHAAAQIARNTVGVTRVRNHLRVNTEVHWDDIQAARRIERMWQWNPYLAHFNLSAKSVNGRATLEGTVSSYFEKAEAEMLAYTVPGITYVNNNISVIRMADPFTYNPYVDDWYPYDYDWYQFRTETKKADQAIRQDIERELWWSPFVSADDILVEVDDGIATLSGSVNTLAERRLATENALEGGALKVVNKLGVLASHGD